MLSIKNFPDDLHREARAAAALRGIDLRELVEEALREKLRRLKAEEE